MLIKAHKGIAYERKGSFEGVKRHEIKALTEFLSLANEDGVLMSSKWIKGSDKWASKRDLPPFCLEVDARLCASRIRRIASYLVEHPSVKKVIIVDWEALELWKNSEFTDGEELIG